MKNQPLYNMPCPIARSLGRIGDGWSMLIMRDALAGFTRFDEFQKSSGVAPNILSRRLKELVEDGLLQKVCYSTSPARYEYHLTPAGRDFRSVILALAEWGSTHFSPEGRQIQLIETATQRPVKMQLVDSENGEPLTLDKYQMVPGPAAVPMMHYRHDYLQKKRAGDNAQKFAPPSLTEPQS
ncbi:winged helix-turn-helix transcriptional regulator [Candidatus Pantoea floridensis]|uniref:Transcriptional regulator, HxlR family n=1 Tax=Candidatus Pantoea floridensis TaxID=1938870 RepID=A0A286BVE4_9GAMM|nr:helix-turn-helix domain-containing protein [Pantoea floridensis]PIF14022.1 HxlR family transcriptional regulator [Enterobacteriaceae bacterium JKS000233]SOD38121.1 transcriptional regulator, HxlR family [Pantoea floridensis]